jgi:hypothetical protein
VLIEPIEVVVLVTELSNEIILLGSVVNETTGDKTRETSVDKEIKPVLSEFVELTAVSVDEILLE